MQIYELDSNIGSVHPKSKKIIGWLDMLSLILGVEPDIILALHILRELRRRIGQSS